MQYTEQFNQTEQTDNNWDAPAETATTRRSKRNRELANYSQTVCAGFSTEVKVALVRQGMTKVDLAKALGIDAQSLSNRLAGRVEWSLGEASKAAMVLNVPLSSLLGGYDPDDLY